MSKRLGGCYVPIETFAHFSLLLYCVYVVCMYGRCIMNYCSTVVVVLLVVWIVGRFRFFKEKSECT